MSTLLARRRTLVLVILLTPIVLFCFSTNQPTPISARAQLSSCPGAPTLRLMVGGRGHLAPPPAGQPQVPARIHTAAATTSAVVGPLNDGDPFSVIAGPQCSATFTWWKIKTDGGLIGWVAEGNTTQYFVEPLPQSSPSTATATEPTLVVASQPDATATGPTATATVQPSATIRPSATPTATDSLPPALTTLTSPDGIFGVAWSPDGKMLATSSSNNFTFWNANGQMIKQISPPGFGGYEHIQWSPDGSKIAGLSRDNHDYIYVSSPDGQDHYYWQSNNGPIADFTWAPDSKGIAYGAGQVITIWTLNHGADLTTTLTNIQSPVTSVAWSDTRLAAGFADSSIRIWIASRQQQTLQNTMQPSDFGSKLAQAAPDYAVTALAWSGDQQQLAAAYKSNRILIWNGDGREGLFTPGEGLRGHTKNITSLAWSPNHEVLASTSEDNTIRLWSALGSFGIVATLPTVSEQVSWSADGHVLTAAGLDGEIRLWQSPVAYAALNAANGTATAGAIEAVIAPISIQTVGNPSSLNPLVWSPDGSRFAGNLEVNSVGLWNKDGHLVSKLAVNSVNTTLLETDQIAWSPDGQTIVTAGQDKQIRFWSPDGTLIKTLPALAKRLTGLAWSPDGKTLASCDDLSVQLRGSDGTLISTVSAQRPGLRKIGWSPDGQLISVIDENQSQTDVIVMHSNGTPWRTLHMGFAASWVSRWSPDGNVLAITTSNGLFTWERNTLSEKTVNLSNNQNKPFAFAWSLDSKMLIVASGKDLQFFRANGVPLGQVNGFGTVIIDLELSPDGSQLASIDQNGTILLWSPKVFSVEPPPPTSTNWPTNTPNATQLAATFTPSPVLIPTGGPLTAYSSVVLSGHTGSIQALAWSPDGKTLASGSADSQIKLWQNGELVNTLNGVSEITALAWSPDGSMLAAGSNTETIQLWSVTGKSLQKFRANEGTLQLAWSPDGSTLASRDHQAVWLWSAHGHQIAEIPIANTVSSMAWSPDGKMLATGEQGQHVVLYSPYGIRLKISGAQLNVNSLQWSADGSTLIAVGFFDRIMLLDVKSPAFTAQFLPIRVRVEDDPFSYAGGTSWSPVNNLLALYYPDIADTILILDTTGRQIGPLHGHHEPGTSLAWSSDGSLLASGSMDNTVRIWHSNGALAAVLDGHSDSVNVLAWSPDGKTLATGSADNTIRLWTATQ